jgi:hypothetical protein
MPGCSLVAGMGARSSPIAKPIGKMCSKMAPPTLRDHPEGAADLGEAHPHEKAKAAPKRVWHEVGRVLATDPTQPNGYASLLPVFCFLALVGAISCAPAEGLSPP